MYADAHPRSITGWAHLGATSERAEHVERSRVDAVRNLSVVAHQHPVAVLEAHGVPELVHGDSAKVAPGVQVKTLRSHWIDAPRVKLNQAPSPPRAATRAEPGAVVDDGALQTPRRVTGRTHEGKPDAATGGPVPFGDGSVYFGSFGGQKRVGDDQLTVQCDRLGHLGLLYGLRAPSESENGQSDDEKEHFPPKWTLVAVTIDPVRAIV